MRLVYTNLDIKFTIDTTDFYVLNIVFEHFHHSMPKHSHGLSSYEIHYIPYGHGTVNINGLPYEVKPNTLYVTGPYIEHEQIPSENDPMAEYCIYFKLKKNSDTVTTTAENISQKFEEVRFWFGQDTQELYALIQQLFAELEHHYTGYMVQVKALLQQFLVKLIRNYENRSWSKSHFGPSNLVDSRYLITEECFLYEYETLTLEVLADRLGLSVRQTERFLKDYYGKTFLQKKADAKMSMAKIYLKDPHMSISEIANRLNYSSIQHFSYAFKQYYGVSASIYRKSEKLKRNIKPDEY